MRLKEPGKARILDQVCAGTGTTEGSEMRRVAFVLFVLLWSASPAFAAGDTAQEKFKSFCAEWMKKLEKRETDNRAAVRWKAGPNGVQGEYVGYSREHICRVKPLKKPKAVPIGKIVYTEVRYRCAGPSTSAALKSPRPIEATEVTEIFRYSRGKWVY
jgi:hypothetical protein